MVIGPGKYDALAATARKTANARGVILVIVGGDKGEGFSVQGPASLVIKLPDLLRTLAERIEIEIHDPAIVGRFFRGGMDDGNATDSN